MDYKTQTIALLELAQLEQQTWMKSLSDTERMEAGTLEKWSAKDLFAHIAAWNVEMTRSLSDPDPKNLSEAGDELERANAAIFTQYCSKSWDEVNIFFGQSYLSLLEKAQALPQEVFSQSQYLPWQSGLPVWRWLIEEGYMHPLSHFAHYDLARGHLENAQNIQEKATDVLLSLDSSAGWQSTIHYNLGCVYALAGETHKALAQLGRAFTIRPELCEQASKDPELASLWELPEFQALVCHTD